MNNKRWAEVVEKASKFCTERKADGEFVYGFLLLILGNMANIYDKVLHGWTEHKSEIFESLKFVFIGVFTFYNDVTGDVAVQEQLRSFFESSNKEMDSEVMGSLYKDFCFNFGLMIKAAENKEIMKIGKYFGYLAGDCFDVISRFVNEKEFYKLMMSDNVEEFADEICGED